MSFRCQKPRPMSDNVQTEPWVQAILDRFEAVENVLPDATWLQGDWPYWVQRVAQEIAKASYPSAHFKVGLSCREATS